MLRTAGGALWAAVIAAGLLVVVNLCGTPASAQVAGGGVGGIGNSALIVNRVGGVFVDAQGIVQGASTARDQSLTELREFAARTTQGDVSHPAKLRKVSLARLEAAVAAAHEQQAEIPGEMLFLAGLQRIEYVFVYPDEHDIVLAGPAEGWRVDDSGSVVGQQSGRPVMLLDDLLTALQSTRDAAQGGITCSIDPTPEGMRRLDALFKNIASISGNAEAQALLAAVEESLGPQQVTLRGVPADSHMARVLVAADYRMKRLAMNLEPSPVDGMPSYLELVKSSSGNLMPRWWMVPQYAGVTRDEAGLAWQLRRGGVRVMTEDDFIAAGGQRAGTGRSSAEAERWAGNMTQRYEQLAERLPIFAELENVMDLAVVAALITAHDLPAKSGCLLQYLTSRDTLPPAVISVPKQVGTEASFVKRGRNYVVSAAGGVEMTPWQIATKPQVSDETAMARPQPNTVAAPRHWWWD